MRHSSPSSWGLTPGQSPQACRPSLYARRGHSFAVRLRSRFSSPLGSIPKKCAPRVIDHLASIVGGCAAEDFSSVGTFSGPCSRTSRKGRHAVARPRRAFPSCDGWRSPTPCTSHEIPSVPTARRRSHTSIRYFVRKQLARRAVLHPVATRIAFQRNAMPDPAGASNPRRRS